MVGLFDTIELKVGIATWENGFRVYTSPTTNQLQEICDEYRLSTDQGCCLPVRFSPTLDLFDVSQWGCFPFDNDKFIPPYWWESWMVQQVKDELYGAYLRDHWRDDGTRFVTHGLDVSFKALKTFPEGIQFDTRGGDMWLLGLRAIPARTVFNLQGGVLHVLGCGARWDIEVQYLQVEHGVTIAEFVAPMEPYSQVRRAECPGFVTDHWFYCGLG